MCVCVFFFQTIAFNFLSFFISCRWQDVDQASWYTLSKPCIDAYKTQSSSALEIIFFFFPSDQLSFFISTRSALMLMDVYIYIYFFYPVCGKYVSRSKNKKRWSVALSVKGLVIYYL